MVKPGGEEELNYPGNRARNYLGGGGNKFSYIMAIHVAASGGMPERDEVSAITLCGRTELVVSTRTRITH